VFLYCCAFSAPYCILVCELSHCAFFLRYPINGTIFRKKNFIIKCVLIFYSILSETFLILRIIKHNIIINVNRPSCKVSVFLLRFQGNLHFLHRFSKNNQTSNIEKIRPVVAELFCADGHTDGQT
jgi:hypothetical protein